MVSPDGRWLYYRSALKGTLRRVSIIDGSEEVVFDPAGNDFSISSDTTRIAVIDNKNGGHVFRVLSLPDLKEQAVFKPADTVSNPVQLTWTHDGKNLAYVLSQDFSDNRSIWFQPVDGSKPRLIADQQISEMAELSAFAISYDSSKFALIQGTWNHNAVLIKGLKLSGH